MIGVNSFTETEPNPLLADLDAAIQTADPAAEAAAVASLDRVARGPRRRRRSKAALENLRKAAKTHRQPDGRDAGVRAGRRDDGGVVRSAARGVRRVPRPDRGRPA